MNDNFLESDCETPGCPHKVTGLGSYCEECEKSQKKDPLKGISRLEKQKFINDD
jgi:hypothetical protein